MSSDDKAFMRTFSGIILGLVIVTILIIVIALNSDSGPVEDNNPSRVAMADERTAPIGAVRTEMPAEPAAEEQVAAAEPVDPADIDGEALYTSVCQACHVTGAAGAPKLDSNDWAERSAKGLEALTASAINGIGAMPPKGGRMDLSDAEITAAVEFMLNN